MGDTCDEGPRVALGDGFDGDVGCYVLFFPRRKNLDERPEDEERENGQAGSGKEAFASDEAHLVGSVAEEALGEELAADDDVPAHGEDADLD